MTDSWTVIHCRITIVCSGLNDKTLSKKIIMLRSLKGRSTALCFSSLLCFWLTVCGAAGSFAAEPEAPNVRLQRLATETKTLYEAGKYLEAVAPARELLALTEQTMGEDHQLVSQALSNLALLLQKTQHQNQHLRSRRHHGSNDD